VRLFFVATGYPTGKEWSARDVNGFEVRRSIMGSYLRGATLLPCRRAA
jgi:hypothetical protein